MANNRETGSRGWEVGEGKYGDKVEGEEEEEERPGKPDAKGAENVKKRSRGQNCKDNWRAL